MIPLRWPVNSGGKQVRPLAASGTAAPYRGSALYRGGGVMDHEEQGVLMYKCPDTGRAVRTSIQTNNKTLKGLAAFKISVWCPHCAAPHQIAGTEALLSQSLLAG